MYLESSKSTGVHCASMGGLAKARELAIAVVDLRELCLHSSSRWAAEQISGFPDSQAYLRAHQEGSRAALENAELNVEFLFARQIFECREYRRAAHCLKDVPGDKPMFLHYYSLYLAGEKAREEGHVEQYSGLLDPTCSENKELEGLDTDLRALTGTHSHNPFLYYVHGLVLSDRQRTEEAQKAFLASLNLYPCHWGAWQALQALCPSLDVLQHLPLPSHWMSTFFVASVSVELQHGSEGLGELNEIEEEFPRSTFVLAQRAFAHYNLRNFQESEQLFGTLLKRDPYRLEGIDTYSNILYVKEHAEALSKLAHQAVMTDKYRPETCCIIGNYYSLKGSHDKALLYFQRALKLDSHFLSAWTLMGHEYVEIHNCAAAIDAYRRAVHLNPKDFRAWYGLGQAYEMLQMPPFALYYFRRASQLRPKDARMWNAMGICYQSNAIKKPDAAIRCFTRALDYGGQEGVSINSLAHLYQENGEHTEAAHYYELTLNHLDEQNVRTKDTVDAVTYLAEHFKNRGDIAKAEQYCRRLLTMDDASRMKARQLLEEMKIGDLSSPL